MRKISIIICLLLSLTLHAQQWSSMLAYNNVTQIALGSDCVYALSDGSLFSVNKTTEQVKVYDRRSGLHFSDIENIGYDSESQSLLIIYKMGRIDIISASGIRAVTDYFDKDITADKHVNNITFRQGSAYLATEFGVLRFNMRKTVFLECCLIGEEASEVSVKDILFVGDSIYAQTASTIYAANINDNIVDYRYWHQTTSTLPWNAKKGIEEIDTNGDTWSAGKEEGLVRTDISGKRISYQPNSPALNQCYRIRHLGNKIGVVPGSYAIAFGNRPGAVMTQEDGQWKNYTSAYMSEKLGMDATDFCDITFDPSDPSHFYVASFGYGLIEFRNNEFYKHHTNINSPLEPCFSGGGLKYIWVDALNYDNAGNLWLLNISVNGVKILTHDSTWLSLSNVACSNRGRTQNLIFSNQNPNVKIISDIGVGIGVFDDNGTIDDQSDDRAVFLSTFKGIGGKEVIINRIWSVFQTSEGVLLIGTDQGVYCITNPVGMLDDDYVCTALQLDLESEEITDIFGTESVQCFAEDHLHRIWVGTKTSGLYCLSQDLSNVVYHYTGANTPMLSNDIQSLDFMPDSQLLYIGTSAGLMTYKDGGGEGTPTDDVQDWEISYGSMKGWKTHFSYNNISTIEEAGTEVYCVADGALLSIDKNTEETEPLSKLTGLNGANVALVSYNKATNKTLLVYKNGLMDIITSNGDIHNMPDLFLKTQTSPSNFMSAYSYGDRVYICSQLGIINVNMRREEIAETYILRENNQEASIQSICIAQDSIYAASEQFIYKAALTDNVVDYSQWQKMPTPSIETIHTLHSTDDGIYILADTSVFRYTQGVWTPIRPEENWSKLYAHKNTIIGLNKHGLYEITEQNCTLLSDTYAPNDILRSGNDYWIALPEAGIIRWNATSGVQAFETNSPFVNLSYRLRIVGDKLIMLPGGYFGVFYQRKGNIMVLENKHWTNYTYQQIWPYFGSWPLDFCDAAIDPNDPSHFYVASFGYGLMEFRNNQPYTVYAPSNTINGLEAVIDPEMGYTWVDGLALDAEGNLWMTNMSEHNVKVLLKNGKWVRYNNAAIKDINRSKDLLIWNQNQSVKIVVSNRGTPGLGVFYDNGTIEYTGDDQAVFYSSFVDQNNKTISPNFIYSICQMADGAIWVGTEQGLIVIPDVRKLLNHDNSCQRIIIPRNDGTGLGDYLLGNEQINAIAEDAAGRKWIGTETSGLYLVSSDGLETFEHFTPNNSPLVSNAIYTLAIHPETGEIFIGTSVGLMSYQSDANKPHEDLRDIYAYPNPVAANYMGYISITGLMDNTVVNIIDEGGNLVCKTRSNGGVAIWDGRDGTGRRVAPGIYTALCNAEGKNHGVCKIFVNNGKR